MQPPGWKNHENFQENLDIRLPHMEKTWGWETAHVPANGIRHAIMTTSAERVLTSGCRLWNERPEG